MISANAAPAVPGNQPQARQDNPHLTALGARTYLADPFKGWNGWTSEHPWMRFSPVFQYIDTGNLATPAHVKLLWISHKSAIGQSYLAFPAVQGFLHWREVHSLLRGI